MQAVLQELRVNYIAFESNRGMIVAGNETQLKAHVNITDFADSLYVVFMYGAYLSQATTNIGHGYKLFYQGNKDVKALLAPHYRARLIKVFEKKDCAIF